MIDFLPYFTNDGSVGLFSEKENDIYHSSYGALTEAYLKFVLPANLETFFKKKSEIKLLDICYGIGYNSKSFLNYLFQKKILKNKKIKKSFFWKNPKYIGAIYTDNILDEKKRILIHGIDYNETLMKISPFIKTKENFLNSNKNIDSKLKDIIKKSKNKYFKTRFKIEDEINIILTMKLLEQYKTDFFDENIQEILGSKNNSQFFDKNMLNFAKFYQNQRYKTIPEGILSAFLHNIYYRYISLRYKNAKKLLKNNEICINWFKNDARDFVLNTEEVYDIIFLDAFTPAKTPSLWTVDFFQQLFNHLSYDGIILTYSNSAAIRNAFLKNGFYVGKIYNDFEKKYTGTIVSKNNACIQEELDDYDLGLINSKAGILYKDPNFNLTNLEIIANREKEIQKSNLISSTQFIKKYKGDVKCNMK